jgi:ribosome maturation factor RimP
MTRAHDTRILTLKDKRLPNHDAVVALIEQTLLGLGYALVRLMVLVEHNQLTLQIMAEPVHGGLMTLEDCTKVSKVLSPLLDEQDLGAYALEISSPGIDRPLVYKEDYVKFSGQSVKIETHTPIEGQKRFCGTMLHVEDNSVALDIKGDMVLVPLDAVRKAHLNLSETLMPRKNP